MRSVTDGRLRRFAWWLDSRWGLALMFVVALGIRLALAPRFGFFGDLRLFRFWATGLHDIGIRHFYVRWGDTTFVYPPGYMYILDLLSQMSRSPGYVLLKLPAILGDLGLAWVSGVFALRLAPDALRRRLPVRALVIAGVLFNPAVFALSVVWGQVDSVPAAFVLASLLVLLTGRPTARREIAAMVLFAIAFSMKPQSSFLFPVIAYVFFRRHLYRRRAADFARGLIRIVAVGAPGLALFALSGVPFGLSPSGLEAFYSKASNGYKETSVWAFNFWGVVAFRRGDVRSAGGLVQYMAGIPAFQFGTLAFVLATAYVIWRTHRSINRGHNEARVLLAAAAMTSLLAFTLLTRMHERYLFPVFACLAPLILWRGFRRIYGVVSALFVLNLWYPFAFYNRGWLVTSFHYQPVFNWFFGNIDTVDTWQKKMWSLFMCLACLALVALGFRWIEGVDRADAIEERPTSSHDVEPNGQVRAPLASRLMLSLRKVPDASGDTPDATPRWLRLLPLGAVVVACVFSLVILRSEVTPANNTNDSAFHMEMVRWADHQIGAGRVPLDGWFPNLGLGSPFFHHYQSLPYTLTAYAARITGLGDQTTYLWIQYLLLALWPISVYLGARLLSLERWQAAAAAVVSPLIVSVTGYGYEHGSYTWQGLGVYTQLFGMWLLPLAWGLTWRAVTKGKGYALAALVLALTIATHLMTGYLALLTVGVWVLLGWRGLFSRIGRAAVVSVGSLLTAAWVMVPLFADRNYSAQTADYKGTFFNDSYGARKILGWLFTGELFDYGRFPILSLLVAVGFVMCAIRAWRSEAARALLGAWTLSLILFFGRTTWGSLVKVLPGNGDLQMHRFMNGVDMAGILLAGVGLVAVARGAGVAVTRGFDRLPHAFAKPVVVWSVIAVAIVAMLAPAWTERAHYDLIDGTLIPSQRAYEAYDGVNFEYLVREAESQNDGRIYAGQRANWGKDYRIGSVWGFAELENYDADAIGYPYRTIQSLSTDVDASFSESIPAQYEIFNMKYVILPDYEQPQVPMTLVDTRGRHRLYRVDTSGYFQVVDVIGSIAANRTNIGAQTYGFRYGNSAKNNVYPAVAYNGAPAAPQTIPSGTPPAVPPGSVTNQTNDGIDGTYTATVQASRRSAVLLKESFDPRWSVTVDGVKAKPVMLAPSFVGVEVTPGTHTIVFHYVSYPHYPILVTIGAVTLLGLALWPRRRALMARVPRRADRGDG